MAKILRGKLKGKEVKINQWCNDWISVDVDGIPKIITPSSLQYTPKEMMDILQSNKTGTLLREFKPTFDFRFERIKKKCLKTK